MSPNDDWTYQVCTGGVVFPKGRLYRLCWWRQHSAVVECRIWSHSKDLTPTQCLCDGPPVFAQMEPGGLLQSRRLWDANTGICTRTLTDHSGYVNKILYSPQEDQLVSCGYDKTMRLWDVESGACLHTFTGHTYTVSDVAFSPQGDQIATASADKTVRLWNANTREC